MEKMYKLKVSGDNAVATDPDLKASVSARLPVLTLSKSFLDKNKISETEVNNTDSDNTVYKNDTGTELSVFANVVSANRNNNLLLIDPDVDELSVFIGVNDIQPSQFNNREITLQTYDIGATTTHYNSGENIMLSKEGYLAKFKTDKSSFGASSSGSLSIGSSSSGSSSNTMKKITLSVPGMNIGSLINRLKDNTTGLYEQANILEVLELDVNDLNLDITDSIFYTIYADTIFHNRLRYVGKDADLDKIYIPLL